MSRQQYMEDCPGCRPVAVDLKTGEEIPNPELQHAMERAFSRMSYLHRQAWHRVTCLNSRSMLDLALAQEVVKAMEKEASQ